MKFLCLLVLASVLCMVTARTMCQGKARGQIKQFNGRSNTVAFPCKYYALKRQQCGKYRITLSPGHRWLENNYYIDTLWMGVMDTTNDKEWDGRTTNKIGVKFLNANGKRDLFNKKYGTLFTSDVFDTGIKNKDTYIQDKNGTFKLVFRPWDPTQRGKYGHPTYTFECFDKTAVYNDYPAQICGGLNKTLRVYDFAKAQGIQKNHQPLLIYENVFMSDVVQTDDECIEAADIMQNMCTKATRRLALKNCMEILLKPKITECVTLFQCTPMQAFNSCMKWACTGAGFEKKQTELCYNVGEAIDLCGNITGAGNITDRLVTANCYKEYLIIEE